MKLFPFFGKKQAQADKTPRRFVKAGLLARMFAAGDQGGRLTADWPSFPVPADFIVRRHQRILVARSREQVMNNDYAKAYLRICAQNIVGPQGVALQAQARLASGKLDQAANEALERAFREWGKKQHCDVAGKLSWRAIQRQAVRAAVKDGEFFFRKIYGKDAGKFGFALQELDPQRCHPDFDVFDLGGGRFIRAGIEFNAYGKPLAYFFDSVKEDSYQGEIYNYGGRDFIRIPAEEIIHGFLPEMVQQRRGLPWMATGLFRLRQLNGFEDAAIVNARVGAAKMGFIEYEHGYGPEPDDQDDLEIEAEAGTFQELPPGAKLSKFDPQYPAGEFAIQVKAMLRGIAAGFGVSYNSLANDLEGVNFSSIRQGTLDERESWKELQEWLIESLHQPVFDEWLPRALLGNHITTDTGRPLSPLKMDAYSCVTWQPRRWAWIDPRADADAAVTSKNNLMKSPGSIIRESGEDPAAVYREIASDIEQMKAAGIPKDFILMAMGQKLAPPAAAPNDNTTPVTTQE